MDLQNEVFQLARKFLRKVRRSGPNDVMAICPFHLKADGSEEKTPSFAMSLATGLFFCHACQEKGNLFTFLRNIGVPRDVIERGYRFLIDSAASNLPSTPDPLRPKIFSQAPIEEALLGIFENCPVELLNAGFSMETLYAFEVGFDEAHGRITFPLRDLNGKLVGISGRNPPGIDPKYKVYTEEYKVWKLEPRAEPDKRFLLWNADKLYQSLYFSPPHEPLVIVEGFKACMWVRQAGIKNVVALLGSYMSWEQRWIIERIGAPVIIFLDNNYAGRRGTVKMADVLKQTMNVGIALYPPRLEDDDKAQPDSCAPEEIVHAVTTAPSYLRWLMDAEARHQKRP